MDESSSMPLVVLSGDPIQLDRLKAESELPPEWFDESMPEAQAADRLRPSLVRFETEPSGTPSRPILDPITVTQQFMQLSGRLLVKIIVVNKDTDSAKECEHFSTLIESMKTYMLERDTRVTIAVVLVDEGTGDVQPVLEHVNQWRVSKYVDTAFVMTSVLEPKDRFTPAARDIWPVAVGRLLFHWMHYPPAVAVEQPSIFAWRMMSLPPQSERSLEHSADRLVQSLMGAIHQRVFQRALKTAQPNSINNEPSAKPLESEIPLVPPGSIYWTQMDVAHQFQNHLAADRWHPLAKRLADQVLRDQQSANRDFLKRLVQYRRQQWQAVRDEPSTIHQLALRKDVDEGTHQREQKSEDDANTKMHDAQQHRDRTIADAARCAVEFELAQQGQVGTAFRIWPCIAVAMAVGYPVLAITYGLFGNVSIPLMCAAATVIGTVLAAWYSAESENRAGIRARQQLDTLLEDVDRSVEQFYIASAKRLRGGSEFFSQYRTDALGCHLRELARRGQAVIAVTNLNASKHRSSLSSPDESDNPHSDADHYRRELSLPLPFDLDINVEHESWWDELIIEQADRFHQHVWQAMLQRSDRYLAGNILHNELLMRWHRFQQTLAPLLITRICRKQYVNASPDLITAWGSKLQRLRSLERELGLLSCHLPSSTQRNDKQAALLVLQNGFEPISQTSTLSQSNLVHYDTPLEILDQMPWLGYWFQQIPVSVDVERGRLSLVDFEKTTLDDQRNAGGTKS